MAIFVEGERGAGSGGPATTSSPGEFWRRPLAASLDEALLKIAEARRNLDAAVADAGQYCRPVRRSVGCFAVFLGAGRHQMSAREISEPVAIVALEDGAILEPLTWPLTLASSGVRLCGLTVCGVPRPRALPPRQRAPRHSASSRAWFQEKRRRFEGASQRVPALLRVREGSVALRRCRLAGTGGHHHCLEAAPGATAVSMDQCELSGAAFEGLQVADATTAVILRDCQVHSCARGVLVGGCGADSVQPPLQRCEGPEEAEPSAMACGSSRRGAAAGVVVVRCAFSSLVRQDRELGAVHGPAVVVRPGRAPVSVVENTIAGVSHGVVVEAAASEGEGAAGGEGEDEARPEACENIVEGDVDISENTITRANTGILVTAVTRGALRVGRNTVVDSRLGVRVLHGLDVRIDGNLVRHCQDAGILTYSRDAGPPGSEALVRPVTHSHGCVIADNRLMQPGLVGLAVQATSRFSVLGNMVEGARSSGIEIKGATYRRAAAAAKEAADGAGQQSLDPRAQPPPPAAAPLRQGDGAPGQGAPCAGRVAHNELVNNGRGLTVEGLAVEVVQNTFIHNGGLAVSVDLCGAAGASAVQDNRVHPRFKRKLQDHAIRVDVLEDGAAVDIAGNEDVSGIALEPMLKRRRRAEPQEGAGADAQ